MIYGDLKQHNLNSAAQTKCIKQQKAFTRCYDRHRSNPEKCAQVEQQHLACASRILCPQEEKDFSFCWEKYVNSGVVSYRHPETNEMIESCVPFVDRMRRCLRDKGYLDPA
eukprot:gnl/MRDRNA2_/MRDRNA2_155632_c0_seq1.p1 gnl/MRDRNA2_/MRDRNA2_155632_c0~~gnl/MRDRNA2_/MRDRNA2_155632_c0_seq1.p1  ORF type:complete len:111 (-),score=15.88 gnl/MRDRNA2_/MRDRNA2_155632_c0_seq1:189-521(-)